MSRSRIHVKCISGLNILEKALLPSKPYYINIDDLHWQNIIKNNFEIEKNPGYDSFFMEGVVDLTMIFS